MACQLSAKHSETRRVSSNFEVRDGRDDLIAISHMLKFRRKFGSEISELLNSAFPKVHEQKFPSHTRIATVDK